MDIIHHSNHSHIDIDQPAITKLPPTFSPNNGTETKLAIEKMTFCPPNTYLGSNKMDEAINCIRKSCTHNIFIANSDAATYLYAFNYSWSRIASEFGTSNIITKPPGLYLLPFFSGHHNSGHWLLIALQHKHSTWTGWIINSLPTSSTLSIQIKNTFETTLNTHITWNYPPCTRQVEVECGPRTLLNIAIFVANARKNKTIKDSIEIIANTDAISNTNSLSIFSRRFVSQIIFPPHHFEDLLCLYNRHNPQPNYTDPTLKSTRRKPHITTPMPHIIQTSPSQHG